MLKEDNKVLHDIIRIMIDIEMSVMNGQYEKAHYLLKKLAPLNLNVFIKFMNEKVRDKVFELHGDKV